MQPVVSLCLKIFAQARRLARAAARRRALLACILCCAALAPHSAAAQTWNKRASYSCAIKGADNINFGTVESSNISSRDVSRNFTINCSCGRGCSRSRPLGIMNFCLGISGADAQTGWRYLRYSSADPAGGDSEQLPFRLWSTQQFYQGIIGSMDTPFPPQTFFSHDYKNRENYFGGDFTFPFTAKLSDSGYNIRQGLYTNTAVITMKYGATSEPLSPGSSCAYISGWPDTASGTMTITANAKSSCNVTTVRNINFGKFPDLRHVPPQTGIIEANCSSGTPYQIGIGASRNLPNDPSRRAMKRNDGSELIYYNLFQDGGHTLPWNTAWGSSGVKKDTGAGAAQRHEVYGAIDPNQDTPPFGTYSDSVIVELPVGG